MVLIQKKPGNAWRASGLKIESSKEVRCVSTAECVCRQCTDPLSAMGRRPDFHLNYAQCLKGNPPAGYRR